MEIMQEILDRRSIRKFKENEVTEEQVLSLIEAARLAPSGNNTQPWKFIIIRDTEIKKKVVAADHNQEWMLKAPVFIACITDTRCRVSEEELGLVDEETHIFQVKQTIRDTAIAITHMMLQAQHIGLGTCWTGYFTQKDMKEALELPEYLYVTGVLAVGYADQEPGQRPRKTLEEIISYEKWDK